MGEQYKWGFDRIGRHRFVLKAPRKDYTQEGHAIEVGGEEAMVENIGILKYMDNEIMTSNVRGA